MKKLVFYTLLLGAAIGTISPARAQYIRINKATEPYALYLNINKVFNFNLYENARLGAEFYFVTPSNNPAKPQLQITAYGAYGTYDRAWKYGSTVAVQFPGQHRWRPFVSFYDDLNQMASINLGGYALLTPNFNTCYVASKFARIRNAEIGVSSKFGKINASVDLRYFREWLLYDAYGNNLYPNLNPDEEPPFADYAEGHARATWKQWTADVRMGIDPQGYDRWYCRALLQYNRNIEYKSVGNLSIFAQGGIATSSTHYQHLFDISGTYGYYYFFNNTLVTLPTNSFVTDRFVRFTATFNFEKYLWNYTISHPQPFVQLSGATGHNYRTDRPMTVFEPAAGFNGLIRWGYLDLGVAAAYRLSPNENDIPQPSNLSRLNYPVAFMIVAKLII